MQSLFDQLAPEIIALVCEHLDAISLARLRLVSRSCLARFGTHFLGSFGTHNADLSFHGMRQLRKLVSFPDLRRSVRTLHLTCLYYHQRPRPGTSAGSRGEISRTQGVSLFQLPQSNSSLPFAPDSVDIWAAEKQAEHTAFSGATMCEELCEMLGSLPNLDTITLEADVVFGPKHRCRPAMVNGLIWREVWAQAIQAFRITMSAIARSRVRITNLAIYQHTKKCSMPTNELSSELLDRIQDEGFQAVGKGLESLSISIATVVVPLRPPTELYTGKNLGFYDRFDITSGQILATELATTDSYGLICLLSMMPNLESLDLHLYNTTMNKSDHPRDRPYQDLMRDIFLGISFPRLTSLTLQCLPACVEDFARIFSSHPQLRFLCLKNMYLVNGSWGAVLHNAVQACTRLASICLSNLWRPDGQGITHLECPTEEKLDQGHINYKYDWHYLPGGRYIWHTRMFAREEFIELAEIDSNSPVPTGKQIQPANGPYHSWSFAYGVERGPP